MNTYTHDTLNFSIEFLSLYLLLCLCLFLCFLRSESLGQVLLFMISWLYLTLKDTPSHSWSKIWIAYDNMCQLLKIRANKAPLPLPPPYDGMWQKVKKMIDALHIRNHTELSCHTDLHPDNMSDMYPALQNTRNTQAAEQTFVWLGRYKKIICSMFKTHHLFFLHRMVKRRNRYTAKCYRSCRKPVLPGAKAAVC